MRWTSKKGNEWEQKGKEEDDSTDVIEAGDPHQ